MTFTTLAVLHTVTTTEVIDITYNSARSGGEGTNYEGSEVTARGVVWSTA